MPTIIDFDGGFVGASILQSNCIFCVKKNIVSFRVKMFWSGGDAKFFVGVSGDANTTPTTWEEITGLTSGTELYYAMNNLNYALFYRVVKDSTTTIATQKDAMNRITYPAIQIRDFVTS